MKERYFSRDISWVDFNARVLSEAEEDSVLPLDKLKFLSIVSSNFDEFFMVRVATLLRAFKQGNAINDPSGLSAFDQLEVINDKVHALVEEQYSLLSTSILPQLKEHGIYYKLPAEYTDEQHDYIGNKFHNEIFPILTPVKAEANRPFPFAGNLRINLAFLLEDKESGERKTVIIQLAGSKDRIIFLPSEKGKVEFSLLEDVVVHMSHHFFQGYKVLEHIQYRLTRDADMGVDEEREDDFLEAMEEILEYRKRSEPVRLEIKGESRILETSIIEEYSLEEAYIYRIDGPLNLKSLMSLAFLPNFDSLREKVWKARTPEVFDSGRSLFDVISESDQLLHHPYQSFAPVINLVQEAADDPDVMAIKMTLYRTSGNSPIVGFLERAAQKGKQVTVMVELKARFDEQQNLEWAGRLERAGVIVVYGVQRLKVHAKALLIVRRESEGIKRYCHLSTGNYNDSTAKLYTDMGFLTADDRIAFEVSLFFNAITGYSTVPHLSKLVMAPLSLRDRIVRMIKREAKRAEQGHEAFIYAKLNSLADEEVIRELYKAGNAGVQIHLNIRGICTLVPGVPGLSEHIHVVSVIDRFLEHTRAMLFHNGGKDEVYLSSADWMPRNLSRRVELMFPVENTRLSKIIKSMLLYAFEDNVKSHVLDSDGKYTRKSGKPVFRMQQKLYEEERERAKMKRNRPVTEFIVRRSSI